MSNIPYRGLIAWQKAYRLALDVLDGCGASTFAGERWLSAQMAKAAMSVPANIAEGNRRSTPLDYASFVDRARGSLFELDTWLLACRDRGLLSPERHRELEVRIAELSVILLALAGRLRAQSGLGSRTTAAQNRRPATP